MRFSLPCLAAAAAAALLAAVPAHADNLVCKKRAEIIGILSEKFGEMQQSFGLQNDTRVLEVFASASGSWTALLTLPNGQSCVVASGQAWTTLPPIEVGQPV